MDNERDIKQVGFSIDAGLIQRLGYELVGKAETAVSELIKNAYDADATIVDVDFIETQQSGGTLVISDNGLGMTENQLINGFMRISSTEKYHNPKSERFKRTRAGKKGIGRFATQRLGEQLTIITQTKNADKAIKFTIDWNKYTIDTDLSSVTFPIEEIDKTQEEGTKLIISILRERWIYSAINRIFGYVLELFQPDYLSESSRNYNLAVKNENSFKVNFNQVVNGVKTPCKNDKISVFDKALASFEGYIDKNHCGFLSINSNYLDINDLQEVHFSEKEKEFSELSDVTFKIYYFIYQRPKYYKYQISSTDLKKIQDFSRKAAGVKLYRNGFRVLPYGDMDDDWTRIDRRWSVDSGFTNVPLNNKSLFGFVEIIDPNGNKFEETASREGLIENEAFQQLSDFIHKSLIMARNRVAEKITKIRDNDDVEERDDVTIEPTNEVQTTKEMFDKLSEIIDNKQADNKTNNLIEQEKQHKQVHHILDKLQDMIEEMGMLRVLASLGLTIGEFTHEMEQYRPIIYGDISNLKESGLTIDAQKYVTNIKKDFDSLFNYIKFFSATISQNTRREKEPIDLLEILDVFEETIKKDLGRNEIEFRTEIFDYDVVTIPMHKSEWNSILFNLYSNSKKAIKRANIDGKILVEVGIDNNNTFINFNDNGDGIPQENRNRIFNAFFSTSTPAGFDASIDEQLVGTGFGLKIVKDIILSYKGKIELSTPHSGYSTCFKITIQKND